MTIHVRLKLGKHHQIELSPLTLAWQFLVLVLFQRSLNGRAHRPLKNERYIAFLPMEDSTYNARLKLLNERQFTSALVHI